MTNGPYFLSFLRTQLPLTYPRPPPHTHTLWGGICLRSTQQCESRDDAHHFPSWAVNHPLQSSELFSPALLTWSGPWSQRGGMCNMRNMGPQTTICSSCLTKTLAFLVLWVKSKVLFIYVLKFGDLFRARTRVRSVRYFPQVQHLRGHQKFSQQEKWDFNAIFLKHQNWWKILHHELMISIRNKDRITIYVISVLWQPCVPTDRGCTVHTATGHCPNSPLRSHPGPSRGHPADATLLSQSPLLSGSNMASLLTRISFSEKKKSNFQKFFFWISCIHFCLHAMLQPFPILRFPSFPFCSTANSSPLRFNVSFTRGFTLRIYLSHGTSLFPFMFFIYYLTQKLRFNILGLNP